MAETDDRGVWRPVAVLPVVTAAIVYGWAHWCLASGSAPSVTVAVAAGAVLIAAAWAAYFFLVGGNGGFLGAFLLAVGLLLVVATADQAAARSQVATCVVREVRKSVEQSAGEGAPPPKAVLRFALSCPGGYPAELKDDRDLAPVGGEIRVAYDPRHRVSPAPDGESSPWKPALCAAVFLGLATLVAAKTTAPAAETAGPPAGA
ncbi:hypothetical protein [Streptomyces sp. G-G2]|uniref:hypothetical protein n=1 Tax=Streptomyces sp. G-G2 TaxID=3046201 RepID=UPI0024BADC11|nr:hypothetical protein [Streptomyces sp. G-G2]MDJ0382081.1 hypothetical protein [Streptomyces sp. G-G2]